MRRTLLTSAAILPLAAGAAFADAHEGGTFADVRLEHGQTYLATELMGTRVYAVDRDLDPAQPLPAGAADAFEDIGEIGDIVIDGEGQLQAVIVDVGGFLGLGEREVGVNWSALVPVFEEDDPTEVFITVRSTAEEMEYAPEVERVPSPAQQEAADAAMEGQPDIQEVEGTEAVIVEEDVDAEVLEAETEALEDAEAPEAAEDTVVTTTEAEVISTEEAEDAAAEGAAEAEAAAEAAGDAVAEGAAEAGAAAENAAEAVGDAAAEAAEGVENAAENAAEAVGDAAAEAGAEVEEEATEATTGN